MTAAAMDRKTIVLAAGGTGGHMFPAEALAGELLDRGHRVVLVTDRRGQTFGDRLAQVETFRIRAATMGRGFVGKARTATELLIGYGQARGILRGLNADAVVGFGGYPSAPTVFAAGRLGLPVALHEQNAVLGRANRMLSGKAKLIATSFPGIVGLKPEQRTLITLTGNPVRPAIAAVAGAPYRTPRGSDPVRLLILGGSQGARIFSEIVPATLALLPATLRARLHVSQQCRPEDLEKARKAYAGTGIEIDLSDFFKDVPRRLTDAHLVICRSGASTVAELAAVGRPAILVPYPHAMDDHQSANARGFVTAGGGWLVPQSDLDPESLARQMADLIDQPDRLAQAAANAAGFGALDAASRLADAVLKLAGAATNGNGGHAHREAAE
ncbi:undecaprenyldiphospho-muramoylpentapeptide beta-N-acetylglucosaminyltransferase [Inquilinus sp. CAU 1745]|uniref:undecaprenyldiphospho-muramoylpentapeptide beta-N-acetylglucosaminyltransferase n=1 Tax=Inquilinus sp. CAU 1745 TaxID=3140369 RepID=UPI00325C299E